MIFMAKTKVRPVLAALGAVTLAGCVSFGSEPPESLLTLSPTESMTAGNQRSTLISDASNAIAVLPIEAPAKIDVLRVPVTVSDTEIAYLQEVFWVEKPARLFRRLLGETIRTEGSALVIDDEGTPLLPGQTLRGTLREMGYDARSSSAIIRFDAVRTSAEGAVTSRRFEARETGVSPDPASVGPALNRAANTVAAEVAQWIAEGS